MLCFFLSDFRFTFIIIIDIKKHASRRLIREATTHTHPEVYEGLRPSNSPLFTKGPQGPMGPIGPLYTNIYTNTYTNIYTNTYTNIHTNTYANTHANAIDSKGGGGLRPPPLVVDEIGIHICVYIGICIGVHIGIYVYEHGYAHHSMGDSSSPH